MWENCDVITAPHCIFTDCSPQNQSATCFQECQFHSDCNTYGQGTCSRHSCENCHCIYENTGRYLTLQRRQMSVIVSQTTSISFVTPKASLGRQKWNIKVPHCWPLWSKIHRWSLDFPHKVSVIGKCFHAIMAAVAHRSLHLLFM